MLVRQDSVASFMSFASNQEYLAGIGHRVVKQKNDQGAANQHAENKHGKDAQ